MARVADPGRRAEILRAARNVFQERGYTEARMAEIAERAGIAAGTLYLYFPSKEALAQALGDDYLTRLTETVLPYLTHADAGKAIARSVHAALAFSAEEQDLLRFIHFSLGPGNMCGRSAADVQLHQTLAQILVERMERKELVRYDPHVLAELITGLMQWVAERIVTSGAGELERYERTLIQMLQHALLPPASALSAPRSSRKKIGGRNSTVASSRVPAG